MVKLRLPAFLAASHSPLAFYFSGAPPVYLFDVPTFRHCHVQTLRPCPGPVLS